MTVICKNIIWGVEENLPTTEHIHLNDDEVESINKLRGKKYQLKLRELLTAKLESRQDISPIDFLYEVVDDKTMIYVVTMNEADTSYELFGADVFKAFKTRNDAEKYVRETLDEFANKFKENDIEIASVDYDSNLIVANGSILEFSINEVNIA